MELDLFQSDFSSDKLAIVSPARQRAKLSETVKLVETLTSDQQRLLLEILRNLNSKNPLSCHRTTSDLQTLIQKGMLIKVNEPQIPLAKYKKIELQSLASDLGLNPDKKLLKQDLMNYILDHARTQLSSADLIFTVVTFDKNMKYGKLHMYLHRKYDSLDYFDGINLYGTPLLETKLPEDDVTALLREYGYYKS